MRYQWCFSILVTAICGNVSLGELILEEEETSTFATTERTSPRLFLPRLVRRLWALTREDVRTSIFQRHSSEDSLDRTVSPIPKRTTEFPTLAPATAAPAIAESSAPTIGSSIMPTITITGIPSMLEETNTTAPAVQSQETPTLVPTIAPTITTTDVPTALNVSTEVPTVVATNGTEVPTSNNGTQTPTISLNGTLAPTITETLQEFLERTLTDTGEIDQSGSAQNDAFLTIGLNFPDLRPSDGPQARTRIAQLYAMQTLYYGLNGPDWRTRDAWVGNSDVCDDDWFGVECNDEQVVIALNLTDNDLMGSIPSEIRALSNLGM